MKPTAKLNSSRLHHQRSKIKCYLWRKALFVSIFHKHFVTHSRNTNEKSQGGKVFFYFLSFEFFLSRSTFNSESTSFSASYTFLCIVPFHSWCRFLRLNCLFIVSSKEGNMLPSYHVWMTFTCFSFCRLWRRSHKWKTQAFISDAT